MPLKQPNAPRRCRPPQSFASRAAAYYNGDRLKRRFFPHQKHALPDEIMKLCQKSIGPLAVAALICLIGSPAFGAEKSKAVGDKELSQSLYALLAVKAKGVGNVAASEAWRKVTAADPSQLTAVLAAMDQADPLAANWIAAAVETIADRQVQQGKLPADKLEAFVLDTQHAPRARRLAFEWLVQRRQDRGRSADARLFVRSQPRTAPRRSGAADRRGRCPAQSGADRQGSSGLRQGPLGGLRSGPGQKAERGVGKAGREGRPAATLRLHHALEADRSV